jgi:4-hydroxy-tetrahydrodipicolinate reductase
MKIALLGYGRMGQEIENISVERDHNILHRFTIENLPDIDKLQECDVAIDFSIPDSAVANIKLCFQAGVPVVVGTTGWYDKLETVRQLCEKHNGTLLYASNCSLGVNILFKINDLLAKLMQNQESYDVRLREVHHIAKKDAPSGTALTLAESILNNIDRYKGHKALEENSGETIQPGELPVFWKREGDVKGIHEVSFISKTDRIDIRHEAYTRKGFARGAVIAAEWLKDKKGVFTMLDLIEQL